MNKITDVSVAPRVYMLPPIRMATGNKLQPEEEDNPFHITLQKVVQDGNLATLSQLLSQTHHKDSVNDLDEHGMGALHYAAKLNSHEKMELLLEKGSADPMIRDSEHSTPLHYICRRKNHLASKDEMHRLVDLLIKYKCNVNIGDKYDSTPLHFCAMRDNVLVAKAIIKSGIQDIDINAADKLGCTPLHEAATYNNSDMAKLLIKKGADLTITDDEGCTALHLAAMEGEHEVLEIILKKAACSHTTLEKIVNVPDEDKTMPLHYAVENKNLENVRLLIKHGAMVNARCRIGRTANTPLHLAAVSGDLAITQHLLNHGALVNSKDLRGATPLHRAAQYNSVSVAAEILKKEGAQVDEADIDNYTPLLTAIANGNKDVASLLLEKQANICAHDNRERSALYIAVENNHADVLKYLVAHCKQYGYDLPMLINYCDKQGNSSLHVAAEKGNTDIVEILLSNGASLSGKNEDEETPFLRACSHGNIRVAQILLGRNDMLINDEDEESNTGLHLAAEEGFLDIVKYLIRHGAEIDAKNNRFHTPLDLAAMKGHLEIVCHILDRNVSPNSVDKDKETPLQLAARRGKANVVSMLLDRGANVTKTNVEGKNCLDIAIEAGQRSVVEVILNSKIWYKALSNDSSESTKSKRKENKKHDSNPHRDTPLRKLIKTMPDMAFIALENCIRPHAKEKPNDPDRYYEFIYDFLDDTCVDYDKLAGDDHFAARYTDDANYIKSNHPLSLLINEKNEAILEHPVVLSLTRHKWNLARRVYYLFTCFYMFYVSLITSYMLISTPPHQINVTICKTSESSTQPTGLRVLQYLIWISSVIGIINEIIQIVLKRRMYLRLVNLLDWYCYISAIILVVPLSQCGAKTEWQWQIGAFTLLLSWIDLLLFLRRLPGHGLYVVMITEICHTFLKFFVTLSMFIVAFALTFHVLIGNQPEFGTEMKAIVKSYIMMIGEFNYIAIFHNENESKAMYESSTFVVFVLFATLMSIILMNLLIGLAVSDVNGLREQQKLSNNLFRQDRKQRLLCNTAIELALDIELALPTKWAIWCQFNVRTQKFYLNRKENTPMSKIKSFFEGSLVAEETLKTALTSQERLMSKSKEKDFIGYETTNVDQGLHWGEMQRVGTKIDHIDRRLEELESKILSALRAK